MLQEKDLAAGAGVGTDIETGDEIIEERLFARITDEEQLVGAVVGLVSGGGANLGGEGTAEEGAELVGDIGGLGEFEVVGFDGDPGGGGAVEGRHELLDALEVADRVSDEDGVAFLEEDRLGSERGIEETTDLGNEFCDAEEFQVEEFGGDAAGPVAWVADNHRKGISAVPALTVHATGAFSREHFDVPPDEVAGMLIDAVRPWIDGDPRTAVVERSIHRWKFATPTTILPDPFVAVSWAPPILCCGDAFAGPRVEGAFSSGVAAGTMLADRLAGAGR